jgi:hypothetical protein
LGCDVLFCTFNDVANEGMSITHGVRVFHIPKISAMTIGALNYVVDGACTYPLPDFGACTYPLLVSGACTLPHLQNLVS